MPIASLNALFDALIRGKTTTEVRAILADVGDHADLEMDKSSARSSSVGTRSTTICPTSQEVVEQITKLLLDSGLRVEKPGVTQTEGQGDAAPVSTRKRPRYRVRDPLPTLPYPFVTRFEIVTPRPTLQVALNDHELVLVETDADAEFDRLGKVAIRAEPALLEQLGKAPLRGGRVRWRLRPSASATAGAIGRIVVSITKPDGSQLTDEIGFQVLPAKDEKSKKDEGSCHRSKSSRSILMTPRRGCACGPTSTREHHPGN
jgi:hypothetical protein